MNDPARLYGPPRGGDTEYGRLDDQHKVWTLLIGGLWPSDVEDKVNQLMERSEIPSILDVGCGSGIWSIQMGQRYPTAHIVGVDLTHLDRRSLPPNFSFKNHNLANGLPAEYKSSFDIIHCRTVCQHVPNPQGLVDSMAECLKPNGLLLIGDLQTLGFDEDKNILKPYVYDPLLSIKANLENKNGLSWHSGWFHGLAQVMEDPKYQLPSGLIKQSKLLTEVFVKDFWAPCGWEGNGIKYGKEIGELVEKDFRGIYAFSRGMYDRREDLPPEIRDALVQRGLQELLTQRTHFRFHYVVAIKRDISSARL